MPWKVDGKTSTCRTVRLDEVAIWQLGDQWIAEEGGRSVLARAVVTVATVRKLGLEVDPDNVPPRHASIIGWPNEKDAKMSLAQVLAAAASPPIIR